MAAKASPQPKHKESKEALTSDALRRHERFTLFLFLEGALALVAGMVLISEFLSGGKVDNITAWIAGSLFGILALGFLTTFILRRRADKKNA